MPRSAPLSRARLSRESPILITDGSLAFRAYRVQGLGFRV